MTLPAEIVVAAPEDFAACCADLARWPRLGLDTEFVGEDSYEPDLCLIQVATPETLYLIDPFSAGPVEPFWQLLLDPARLVVVHAGREEVRLCHRATGQTPPNVFDLQIAAGLVGLNYPMGHGNLVHALLGKQLDKAETLTEWRSRPLTKAQIRYAFDDVRFLLALWQKLDERLTALGRGDWAREEFDRLRATVTPADNGLLPSQADRWRKLRGIGSLDRKRLAMVRELYLAREALAAENNRPARTILRDDLLVEIARRNPKTPHDVQVVRGMTKRFVGAFFAAVERARSSPPDDHPKQTEREQDQPQLALVTSILTAVMADFCAREKLAPGLTATTNDLRCLARAKLLDVPVDDSPLTRGWRSAHLLPHLQAVLDGRRAVRVADVRADAPFAYLDAE